MNDRQQWLVCIAIGIMWITLYAFMIVSNPNQVQAIQENPHTLIQFEEPCSTSSFKSYMDYRMISDETSYQYKFIQEHMTINDKGYLVDENGYIGLALGSQFGEIGTKVIFNLSSGNQLYGVKIEHKDDKHTINGCEHYIDTSVIEFVIDTDYFELGSNGYIYLGNFDNVEYWNGTIESVRYVE